jgi:hypothetical protein
MNVGMLWFDNDPKSELNTKIARAANYYRTKYGKTPDICFVHPTMLVGTSPPNPVEDKQPKMSSWSGGIEIRSTRAVLPNHFWIGINGANGSKSGFSES